LDENEEEEGRGKKLRGKKPPSKKNSNTFKTYIHKILKQVHPDTGISNKAMCIMDDIVNDLLKRIVQEAVVLTSYSGKNTITSREIQTAVRLVIPGELCKHAVSEGTKAVTKLNSNPKEKAGLTIPIGRTLRILKQVSRMRSNKFAACYLAAVLEYLAAELLELSGNVSRDSKKVRIIPRHINISLRNDEELSRLFEDGIIAASGVLPYINSMLLGMNYDGFEVVNPNKYGESQDFTNNELNNNFQNFTNNDFTNNDFTNNDFTNNNFQDLNNDFTNTFTFGFGNNDIKEEKVENQENSSNEEDKVPKTNKKQLELEEEISGNESKSEEDKVPKKKQKKNI